jgi:UDP-glucose 4-epimerase
VLREGLRPGHRAAATGGPVEPPHVQRRLASGRPTTNGELVAAIKKVIPGARIELPAGRDPNGPGDDVYLDITRINEDTGYRPAYDAERAVADYVGWLRAGNER